MSADAKVEHAATSITLRGVTRRSKEGIRNLGPIHTIPHISVPSGIVTVQ